jgi:hypothetical protein
MLTMNVAKMSHAELADAVSRSCAPYGAVTQITLLQPPDQPQMAFALVGMVSESAIDRVVAGLGAVKVESLAVIRVEQAAGAALPGEFKSAANEQVAAV